MDPITREEFKSELEEHTLRVEKTLTLTIQPLVKDVDKHARTLYGKNGSNGLTGKVAILAWGYGLLVVGLIFIVKKFFS